jgi:hypothetical protein
MTVRIVERVHLEAFLTAMYIYFGGPAPLERVIGDGYAELVTLRRSVVEFDWQLRRSKRKIAEKMDRLSKANSVNEDWNNAHPDQPPRPMLPLPHVPRLPPVSAVWPTSFLATHVLGDAGSDVTIAWAIADALEAQPGAQRGWFPGR